MAASKSKSMSNLFRFALKNRQNSASAAVNHAGISYRTAEICRSLHTPSKLNIAQEEIKSESESWNQAFETLRRLGVKVSVEEKCKSVTKEIIDNSILSSEPFLNRRMQFWPDFNKRSIDDSISSGKGRAQIMNAFEFLRKQGLSIEEEMYSTGLCNLIDKKMKEDFQFLIGAIKEESHDSSPGLGYYEMLLWIKLENKKKIEEIGRRIIDRWNKLSRLELNYLEAFCVTCQYEYLKRLLTSVDITKASSLDQLTPIFEYLGRLKLLSDAMRLLGELKGTAWAEHISHFIFSYATSVEYKDILGEGNIIETCGLLHTKVGIKPSFEFFEKLIAFECESEDDYCTKVALAAKIVDEMRQNGFIEKSEEGRYLYDTIKRTCGIDWLRATEDAIDHMGLSKFELNKFVRKFSDYKV